MSTEKIAQRFAFDRPGYTLIDFIEIGLPVYKLALVGSFLEEKPVPALHEFVLRAVSAGLQDETEVSGILGLETGHIAQVLAELDSAEFVSVQPQNAGGRRLLLTTRGQKCLAKSSTVVPKLSAFILHFDGLTRALIPPQAEALWQYRQLSAAGIREIATKPPRKPNLQEIPIQIARKFSSQLSELRGKSKRDLLAIKAIESTNRVFQLGQILLYRSNYDSDIDFSIVIDGCTSDLHKDAIIKAGGLARFGFGDVEALKPPELPVVSRLSEELLQDLREHTDSAKAALEEAHLASVSESKHDTNNATDEVPPTPSASDIKDAVSAALAHIKSFYIRHIEVFEHPTYLDQALESSERRLLIISPWIKKQVLDIGRFRLLRNLLEGGCSIYIGWGIGKADRSKDNDIDVVRRLEEMEKEFANFYFKDLDNTHEKILIKDSSFVITTSFNWLSFRGDPKRTLRYERGVYIGIKEFVDEEFGKLVGRFHGTKDVRPSEAQLGALAEKFGR
ncbi:phospholipase D-like domain-containing protein [Methylobacterium fujisawaense]|uniref:hypothetical protein n=1 Tax=Methylobacterium fujisawaense TaxID=107400 RepID=UPI0036FE8D2D